MRKLIVIIEHWVCDFEINRILSVCVLLYLSQLFSPANRDDYWKLLLLIDYYSNIIVYLLFNIQSATLDYST